MLVIFENMSTAIRLRPEQGGDRRRVVAVVCLIIMWSVGVKGKTQTNMICRVVVGC
jgi:hypothetical protein